MRQFCAVLSTWAANLCIKSKVWRSGVWAVLNSPPLPISVAEELFSPCGTLGALGDTSNLPVHPARFCDDMIGLKRASTLWAAIKAMEAMYVLDLHVESTGDTLQTLKGVLSLEQHNH